MTFKELTYKNDKLRLKEGRVNKNYSVDKINCRRNPNAKEDLEPFILPFDVAWQIQDGVIALDSEFIIYKCSPKKVKQFIVDSSIPPSEFSVLDFDKVLETVKDKELTDLLNDRNSYFTNSSQNKNIKLTKEERNIKYYEYWTNDCILVFSRNQDVYMTDIMSGFNYLYPDSLQRKRVFGKLSKVTEAKIPYITTNVFSGYKEIYFNGSENDSRKYFKLFRLCTGQAFAGINHNSSEPIKSILSTLSERVYKLFTAPSNLDLNWSPNLVYCGSDVYDYNLENVQKYHKVFLELSKEHENINTVEEARNWYAQYLLSPYSSNELNLYTLKHTKEKDEISGVGYSAYTYLFDNQNDKLLICSFGLLMRDLLSR